MKTYEIPDPFTEFVKNRNRKLLGATYDYFAKEWHMKCGCCQEDLYAPTRKSMKKNRLYHTRNICLGGY